jgi:RNA polymerase sigma-70 factor (ECF subfamily)
MGTPQGRFERLYRAHTNAVMLYALRRTSPADAADVHSEVFLVAWRRLDEVPEEAGLPWLYGVARRVLANQRRGQRRQSDLADHLRAHAPQPVTPDASTVDDLPLLAAMETLSEEDREVLRLVAWEDLAPREAARVLGCRPATCRVRLHRARRRLAGALTQTAPETSPTSLGATCDPTMS